MCAIDRFIEIREVNMIKSIPGTYKTIWISRETGTVYNLLRGFLALRIKLDKNGYPYVNVPCLLRKPMKIAIHMAYAEAFIKKEDVRYNTVNHKNTLKADYSISNLEWTTNQANCRHSKITGCDVSNVGFDKKGQYIKDTYKKDGTVRLRSNERKGYINRVRDISGVSARNLELESDFDIKELWPDINITMR